MMAAELSPPIWTCVSFFRTVAIDEWTGLEFGDG